MQSPLRQTCWKTERKGLSIYSWWRLASNKFRQAFWQRVKEMTRHKYKYTIPYMSWKIKTCPVSSFILLSSSDVKQLQLTKIKQKKEKCRTEDQCRAICLFSNTKPYSEHCCSNSRSNISAKFKLRKFIYLAFKIINFL